MACGGHSEWGEEFSGVRFQFQHGLRLLIEMTQSQSWKMGMRGKETDGEKVHLAKGGSAPQRNLRESAVRSTSNSSPE